MDPGKWERVKAVYHSALDREPGDRNAFVEQACQDNQEVLREVQSLLAKGNEESFLERPAWQSASEPAATCDEAAPTGWHPFLCVVWLATACVTAGFGWAVWKFTQDWPSFGWSEAPREGHWRVTGVNPTGPAAGKLQPGDILLSLNGDSWVARRGTVPYRRVLRIGAPYRLRVQRGGVVLEYDLRTEPVRRKPGNRYLNGLAWCLTGLFFGFARPQDRLARLAFAASVVCGLAFLGVFVPMPLYALQPMHVLGYHFFYLFPGEPPRARGWKTLLWLLYLASASCLAYGLAAKWLLLTGRPQAVMRMMTFGPLVEWCLVATATVSMLAAAAVAVHKYRALTDAGWRRRFHWVAVGGVAGLTPAAVWVALDYARQNPAVARWLPAASSWAWFTTAANSFSAALPVSVAYAVIKHQVFDVKVAIRRGVQYLLARRALQFLLALPGAALLYTLIVERHRTIAELVSGSRGYLFLMAALGLSLKFRAQLIRWLDRKFFREQYDSEQLVLSLVDEFARFDSAEDLLGFVRGQLERSLHPKSIHLWRRENGSLKLASGSDPSLAGMTSPISEALLANLRRTGNVARVPLVAGAGASRSESRWLAEMGVRLIVPIGGAERTEGALMLGEKQSEEPYSDDDARLLHAVARETAVILDNLRLKEQVKDEQRVRREVLARFDSGLVSLMRECPACGACYDSGAELCGYDGNSLTLTVPVARTIDGKYRLDRLIGRGGMGAVYLARDLRLKREVAVKVMLAQAFGHEGALRRFRREAQAVARLNHPNVVALYDFGELEGGGAYLVMERVPGVTLRAEIKQRCVFPPVETAAWLEQVLDGLAAAHSQGVIHRDLKPENVLGARASSGPLSVKILDFGLAKIRPGQAAAGSHSLTESGVVLGTLAYMAPEQILGRDADARADVYAAGVIVVEMLTGAKPSGDALSFRQDFRLPPGLMNVAALDSIIRRALAAEPNDRPVAAEFRGALIPGLRACAL